MPLNKLVKTVDKPAKRVGRGLASGKGKTAGRGTKGQKSRSGYNIPRRFQGGQTSMIQRLPKVRGFKSRFEKPIILNLAKIEAKFNDGELVNFKSLIAKGFIRTKKKEVKIIGATKFTKNLKFAEVKLSEVLSEAYKNLVIEKPVAKEEKEVKVEKTVAKKAPVKKTASKK
ncbi:MAG: 50S ribosomal protein L15 [Candidatus Berkelbacteria bacterium]